MSDTVHLNRRVDDPRIKKILEQSEENHRTHVRTRKLADDILRLNGEQIKMQETLDGIAETLSQVRDILITFKVTNAIAKWIAAIGAACAAIYFGWHKLK